MNFFKKFFQQLKYTLLYFDKYSDLLKNKLYKVILFGIILLNFSLICGSIVPIFINYAKIGGFDNFVTNIVPEFKVEDNKLIIDEYSLNVLPNNIAFIFDPEDPVDTSSVTSNDLELLNKYNNNNNFIIIKVTPSYILTNNIFNINSSVNLDIYLDLLQIKSREDLFILKQPFLLATFFSLVLVINVYNILYIIMLLMGTIWINFFAICYQIKLPFKDLLKFTIYINTAPMILQIMFQLTNLITTPFKIIMPSTVYFGVLVAYVHFVFKHFQQEKLYILEPEQQI